MDQPLGDPPTKDAPQEVVDALAARNDDYEPVQCLMLTCMNLELQKHFERSSTQFIVGSLDALYKKQAGTERFEITITLIECNMAEGSSMSEHIVKLAGYVDILALLDLEFRQHSVHILCLLHSPILRWFYYELKHEQDCKRFVCYAQNCGSWNPEEQRSVDGQ